MQLLYRHVDRGRAVVVGFLVAYFGLVVAIGGYSQWDRLGVNALTPFLDLRSVTSAWECARRHIPVIAMNPCDPAQRPANYPRIWESPAFLGLGQGSTTVLGFVVVAIFLFGALAIFPRRATILEAVVYALVLCSPAAMLGVARANVDLVLFTLVVVAVLLLRRQRTVLTAHLTLLFAAVLKLFPIFAAPLFLRQRPRRALLGCGLVLLGFGVYALATLDDIRTIARVTPQQNSYSYGVRLLGSWLASGHGGPAARVWDVVLVLGGLAVAAAAAPSLGRLRVIGPPRDAVLRGDAFVAGAAIYICTYAAFRSFDYRLVFLLLTVPQLLRWSRRGQPVAIVTLVMLLLTVWLATPWDGQLRLYSWIARWQNWVSLHTALEQPLQPEAIPQFVLFVGLAAGFLAGSTRLPLYRAARGRVGRAAERAARTQRPPSTSSSCRPSQTATG